MEVKECSVCHRELPLDCFYKHSSHKDGFTSECKECTRRKQQAYRQNNKDVIRERKRKYANENKDKIKEWNAKYISSHPETRKETVHKSYIKNKEKKQLYAAAHREKHNQSCKKYIEKSKTDPVKLFTFRMRSLVYDHFQTIRENKNSRTMDIVGLSSKDFADYLLQTYIDNYGEPWDGQTPVNIDHIIPISTAKDVNDVITLNHYSNLQLLKKEDNLKKGSKII